MFLLLVLPSLALAATESKGAWLLASKSPHSQFGVEGMDYVVQYGLYNVGDKPATKVTLDDSRSYSTEYFEIVRGMLQMSVARLNPGENITHTVVLRPLHSGLFNSSAAAISYRPDVHSNQLRSGLTTTPAQTYVYGQTEYERRYGSRYQRFIGFFMLMSPGFFFSLYFYRNYYTVEEDTTVEEKTTANKKTAKTVKTTKTVKTK